MATKSYETPQEWEEQQGTLIDRVVKVSNEAQRVFAREAALHPTIHHEYTVDPAVGDHLQDVGHRIQILKENAKKPDKVALKVAEKHSTDKRVIPSRYPELGGDDDDGRHQDDEDENAFIQGQIETMLMDQEWDTRTWNRAKIHVAVDTLYEEAECAEDPRRRELATTMLIRLLETHETAVDYVESTIPILMNKAFRSLSKIANKTKIFRTCTLLSVLSEWFTAILSRDNAAGKCIKFLLRESEVCARIVQHHWRGALFERSLKHRNIDPSVRTRLRSMHFIKNIELRHQFKVLRDAMDPGGLPIEAIRAYVKTLFHLVKPTASAVDKNRRHNATTDRNRVIGSGILVILASMIPAVEAKVPLHLRDSRRSITEHVKGIAHELAITFADDAGKIIQVLQSNIVERVINDLHQHLHPSVYGHKENAVFVRSSMGVVAAISHAVWKLHGSHVDLQRSQSSSYSYDPNESEEAFLHTRLQRAAGQFLLTQHVLGTLLNLLPLARCHGDSDLVQLVLDTVRSLSGSFGFAEVLDALTSNGGRALEQVILCLDYEAAPSVVASALALFHDMTNHPDARSGFTTAGAVLVLTKWCDTGIENAKNPSRFVLAMTCIALLARQHRHAAEIPPPDRLLTSLGSLASRLDALYDTLLGLVSGSSSDSKRAAIYLHQTVAVFIPIFLRFLVQVKPSDMEPVFQGRKHRSISCIVLGRFFKVPSIVAASFCEATVIHIALSLQCNRLDEVEGKMHVNRSTVEERKLHFLGLKEACKALSRLTRCPATGGGVDLSLTPSITSVNVPPLPQAIVCDVVTRMHVLEDILPLIHVPTDAAEFLDVDVATVHAAVELVGYLRPMPYGEAVRERFLHAMALPGHPHGRFASEKLELLVTIAAPMVLHVLKEKNCGMELVDTCCAALSRLAATNLCRAKLLAQGGLFIALTHIPEVLYDSSPRKKQQRGQHSPSRADSGVDSEGLIDVPASLFTFLAKFCAIAEGREAIMTAQALPRVLRRLQLTNTRDKRKDVEVKSEIAVLIQRLAMCHAVEGNANELFLHFHVVDLLAQIAVDLVQSSTVSPSRSPVKTLSHSATEDQRQWRAIDHVLGAIAALAQDVLVCVPKLVRLNVLRDVALVLAVSKQSNQGSVHEAHVAAAHYHVVNTAWAIASFPFGEYDEYLASIRLSGSDLFLDTLKRIAFDFSLELQGTTAMEEEPQRTIGELARETLRLVRERKEQSEKRRKTQALPAAIHPVKSPAKSRPASPQIKTSKPVEEAEALPTLLASPKRVKSPTLIASTIQKSESRAVTPQLPTVVVAASGAPASVLNGIDLAATRPPRPQPASVPAEEPHFIFARPKQTEKRTKRSKSKQDPAEQLLMLDPLFQSVPVAQCNQHPREDRATRGAAMYRV